MNKKIIIITLSIIVVLMTVGYALFSTSLNITGTANIVSTWNIVFTKIEKQSVVGEVKELKTPTASGTSATFSVDFKTPGDSITYQITIENKGTIDGIIKGITASELGSDAIKFKIEGIKEGDQLGSKKTTTFTVTISYDSNIDKQPNLTDNNLILEVNYVQYTGQDIPSVDPNIVPIRLSSKILKDNVVQSDSNIDFSKISSDNNGKGLYYTTKNTEDNKVTYYFRGDVKNNYVSFGGFYWRIIRINEDGSIRLIYQGEKATDTGANAQIGTSAFNSAIGDNSMVGYMHGTPTTYIDGKGNYSGWAWTSTTGKVKMSRTYSFNESTGVYTLTGTVVDGTYSEDYYGYYTCTNQSTTCTHMIKLTQAKKEGNTYQIWGGETHAGYWSTTYDQAHANEVDSDIKIFLENWYEQHLSKYDSYIADTGFCNDRSFNSGTGVGRVETHYGPGARLHYNNTKTPQFSCPNPAHDLFTVENSKGNKKSDQKVGLITADEVAYAGGVYAVANSSYYLYTGVNYWTMSPFLFSSAISYAGDWGVLSTGYLSDTFVWSALGVRPVINLNANVEITNTKQDGTITNPYIIKTN